MGSETAGPTREELRTLVTGFSSLTSCLGQVPTTVRAEIYAALGVRITYDPSTSSVEAEVSPSHEMLGKTSIRGALGHRDVGAIPPATSPAGEERGVRGFVDMIGT